MSVRSDDESGYRTIIEVKFDENAKVAESFHSAIKAWRINEPNIITLENQNLGDEHAEKLCEFLGVFETANNSKTQAVQGLQNL